MTITQDKHIGELITPLGKDVLVLQKFDGTEGLGELFQFTVDALSEKENIDFDKALGQSCTIKLKTYQDKTRIFDGILTQAQWIEKVEDYYHYRLVLRPWFVLLGHRADCRIFLDKNVKDIIKDVFTKAGFGDYEFKTTADYDTIPYCVQYRETDLAFCSRLMERYGIYYFFKHAEGKHTLVVADSPSSHEANSDAPKLPYSPLGVRELDMEQRLGAWTSQRRFCTGKVQFNDYDYLKPPKKLLAPSEASEKYAHSKLEVYDYPGKYDEQNKGEKLSKFHLQAEQCFDHRRLVDGDAPSLFSGSLVTVEKHPTSSENREYLVVHCNHSYGTQQYRVAAGQVPAEIYRGVYELLPSEVPFRMLPQTPKPRIYGIQTAKVVTKKGEDGEEISTDEHGRIWVKFFWDREPQKTCPIRVAQVWAGKQWGGQFIPRVDMEVVVEFLEGDPDRPLVTGCVFNGDNKYPYDLPGNKTQSGCKTDSSKGHSGYNELMFEDKQGSEDIRMHGQKDHHVTILNSETWDIGQNFMPPKGSPSRTTTLENGDDQLTIQMGDQTISIPMGRQTTTAMLTITHSVGATTVTLTPATKTDESPILNRSAETVINDTAGAIINITAPLINLNGAVLINGMVPMLLPA
jgi:type VI secretion system secreted protein VgrG